MIDYYSMTVETEAVFYRQDIAKLIVPAGQYNIILYNVR